MVTAVEQKVEDERAVDERSQQHRQAHEKKG